MTHKKTCNDSRKKEPRNDYLNASHCEKRSDEAIFGEREIICCPPLPYLPRAGGRRCVPQGFPLPAEEGDGEVMDALVG